MNGSTIARELHGVGVSPGLAIGRVVKIAPPPSVPIDEPTPADATAATELVRDALGYVADELERRAGLASGDAVQVLQATAMIARDSALLAATRSRIDLGAGPASALAAAVHEYTEQLRASGGYLAERATDLLDIQHRAVAKLLGLPNPDVPKLDSPAILVARDLAPSETAMLDPAQVLGLVTEGGGVTSHSSILAAQLGIPAVAQCAGALAISSDAHIAVDGNTGTVVINPTASVCAELSAQAERRASVILRRPTPGHVADKRVVAVYANAGTKSDALTASQSDADGIGLLRTEFMFVDRLSAPTLDEQVTSYVEVFNAFGSRPVTVRTLDAGADKPLRFVPQTEEQNPALGMRGIRLSRRHADLLRTQLQALAAAAEQTNARVRVMAPMVATSEESEWFAEQAHQAGLANVGVMIEVPAAAIRAQDVLAAVDFASIGTNDLAQYVMAADRMSGDLSTLLDAWQPAVLDLIAAAVNGASASRSSSGTSDQGVALSKPVGVCGEAAGDPLLALVLVGLGVDSLSMAPTRIPAIHYSLSLHTRARCADIAEAARGAQTADGARQAARLLAHEDLQDLL